MKFTDKGIRSLKARAERYEVWKDNGNGLGLRVSTKGRKSWIYLYRFEGNPRRMTLGTYPQMGMADANAAHGQAQAMLERGIDPGALHIEQRRKEREAETVAELSAEYLEKWAKPHKRSWKEDQRIIEKDILPTFGKRKAGEIRRRDIITLLDRVADRGAPIQANRTLACIRKMYNFGMSRDIVETSPCVAIKSPSPENRCDRVLDEDELERFWTKLDDARMLQGVRLVFKLQLLTAQRKIEVVGAKWDEFDLPRGWWTIPAGRVKNKLPHRVPLSLQVLDVLAEVKAQAGDSPYLFPSPTGGHTHPNTVNNALWAARPALGLGGVTPHDLRRSAASHMTSMGIPRLVVSKILNHAESGVTSVYDRHSYDGEKRQALDAWGRKLEAIISGQSGNVVEMSRA